MVIEFTNHQKKFTVVDGERLQDLLEYAVTQCPVNDEAEDNELLEFHLVSPVEMAEVNMEYLGHEGPTDVITFDYRTEDDVSPLETERTLGEILVCPRVAYDSAAKFENTFDEEVVLYLIHGILHLSGFDDQDDVAAESMRRAEAETMGLVKSRFDLAGLFAIDANTTEVQDQTA